MDDLKYQNIRTEGVQFEIGEDGMLTENKVEGSGYMSLSDEYVGLTGDIDVIIDIEGLLPPSESVKRENADWAMANLVPMMAEGMSDAPGVSKIVRWSAEQHGIPQDLLEGLQEENGKYSLEKAIEQEDLMMAGQTVMGIPGESDIHKMQHYQTFHNLTNELTAIEPSEGISPEAMEKEKMEAEQLVQIVETFRQHLEVDNSSKSATAQLLARPEPQPQPQENMQQTAMSDPEAQAMLQQGGEMPPQGMI